MKSTHAASALIRKGSEVLIIQRRYPPSKGKWALPGGVVEHCESAEQAAVREIKEELGIEIEIKRLIGIYNSAGRDGNLEYNYEIHCYEAHYKAGDLQPSSEIMDWKWVRSKEEIADLMLTSTARKALEDAGFLS
jgi:8-oxo-dGTP diphosphatase